MRKKLALLADQQQATCWSAELCAQWMGEDPDKAAVLYVDGHVRVYYGHQTQLPRHYVARQKLCAYSTESCHRFQCESCHLFHVKPATHSKGKLPLIGAKRRGVSHYYSEEVVVVNLA